MDIKSMAKSKRSHTQHHQPRKPHNPPKTSSSSSTSAPKKDGGDKKKPSQPKPPSLPSNWDRYEDEVHDVPIYSESDNSSQFYASKAKVGVDADEVKPKSKGADFRDLIAQAKESHTYYSPSFDDKLPDFYQGVGPMLAARGGKLFLQDRDDDFLMDDEAGGTYEAPFLTLDLEDLAEQLSKIDLAKRLFIEPELLPPELRQEADSEVPSETPERQKIPRGDSFDELLALYLEEERTAKAKDDVDKPDKEFSSNVSTCHDSRADADVTKSMSNLGFLDAVEDVHVNYAGEKDANSKFDDAEQVMEINKQDTKSNLEDLELHNERELAQNVTGQDITLAAAEAELDLLLGSFTDTKLFDTAVNVNEPGTSTTTEAPVQHTLGQPAPAFPVTSSLDDELDDLLAVTSNPKIENGLSFSQPNQISSSSFPKPNSKSKIQEDFDSWLDTI